VRPADDPDAVQLFLGDPGALGLVENQYGVVALVRRALVADRELEDGPDPDWPLLSRLALEGARVFSIPIPLSGHVGRPGTVADVPGEGLAVLRAFEEVGAARRDLPQLAATLAAAHERLAQQAGTGRSVTDGAGLVERSLGVLRREGVAGVARRARRLGGRT
jgi:hypothetical protein